MLDKDKYIAECFSSRHLSDTGLYHRLDTPVAALLQEVIRDTRRFIVRFVTVLKLPSHYIDLLTEDAPRLGLFYLLPKVHKAYSADLPLGYPARGIISMSSHPCSFLSLLVHQLLAPIVKADEDVLTNSSSLVAFFDSARVNDSLNLQTKLFTLDVISMFTTLPQRLLAEYAKDEWAKYRERHHPLHPVTPTAHEELTMFVLRQSQFSCGDASFTMCRGTAMGQRHSVTLASIFMKRFFADARRSLPSTWAPVVLRKGSSTTTW